jgi:hypothetical protein
MIDYKAIRKFFAWFLLSYVILLLPAGFDHVYNRLVNRVSNQVFNRLNNKEVVLLKEANHHDSAYDTKLYLSSHSFKMNDKDDYKGVIFQLNLRRIGFIATALLISLIIATPVSLKRKFTAFTIGFVMMLLFVLVKLRIMILYSYSVTSSLNLHQDPNEVKHIKFWDEIFGALNTNGYYFAMLVWIFVCFRKKDWQTMKENFLNVNPLRHSVHSLKSFSKQKSSTKSK